MKLAAIPLAITFLLPLCFSPVFATFLPNISSIPPSVIEKITHGAWDGFKNLTGCNPGEKVDGLAKLKKYFNYFGYIPNLPSNLTDDFDDELEAAIRTYQKNFHLNVTGQLDNQTVAQLVRPRCGVADIVNGTTTMGSGNSSASMRSTRHFHTTAHYSFFPNQPTWPPGNRDLTYSFLPANNLTDEAKSLFSRGFDRWAAVTPLTFTQTESYSTADIRIAFARGDHGDGESFDGTLGTLAHAFSPPNGRLHLDADEEWVVSGDMSRSSSDTAVDLESVAVHEIGHLLGLGHSSVEESIMFPTISSRMRKVDLAQDDIQGVQVLYGSNPNNNGSTTTSQERESSGTQDVRSRSGLGFLFAAGLLTFLGL